VPAYRTLRLPRKRRQVFGIDLNCSEPTVATREEAKAKFREAWEKAGAQFEISIDSTPSTYGDFRPLAIEAAEPLKRKHPHRAVVVKDLT